MKSITVTPEDFSLLYAIPTVYDTIYLWEGDYTINTSVVIPANVSMIGCGNVTLHLTSDVPAFKNLSTRSNIGIENITVKIESAVFTSQVVTFNNVNGLDIQGLIIKREIPCEMSGQGILIGTCNNVNIYDCEIYGMATNCYLRLSTNMEVVNNSFTGSVGTFSGHDGLLIERCDNGYIESNYFTDNDEHGLYLSGVKYFEVIDNVMMNNKNNGIRIGAYPDRSASHILIEENDCNDNVNGIHISDDTGHMSVRNNTCNFNSNYGINSAFESVPSHDNSYVENTLLHNASTAQYKILDINSIVENNIIAIR